MIVMWLATFYRRLSINDIDGDDIRNKFGSVSDGRIPEKIPNELRCQTKFLPFCLGCGSNCPP